jgi:hypothetical protein
MKKFVLSLTICCGMTLIQGAAQDNTVRFGLQNVPFVVRLLSPLSTRNGSEGDAFTASVDDPAQFRGGIMEGHITKLKRPKNGVGKGKAEMQFEFERLAFNNQTALIRAELKDVANSQGARKVDEEGHVIGVTSNKKRALSVLITSAAGAAIGAAAGGATGAVAGAAAGAAAGLFIGLKMTTTGTNIEFRPGSLFILSVSDATSRNP